jgi:hypothetical protein
MKTFSVFGSIAMFFRKSLYEGMNPPFSKTAISMLNSFPVPCEKSIGSLPFRLWSWSSPIGYLNQKPSSLLKPQRPPM